MQTDIWVGLKSKWVWSQTEYDVCLIDKINQTLNTYSVKLTADTTTLTSFSVSNDGRHLVYCCAGFVAVHPNDSKIWQPVYQHHWRR